jgi:serine phosphatase RsbU (regulator of sigma subunit)
LQLDEKRRQLEAELARAAQVQMDLLPHKIPSLPGFQLAARCEPARQVGGDFYDWHVPAPAILTLSLGDVMGKGMPAALLMATMRAVLRTVDRQGGLAAAVEIANRAIEQDLERSGSFVTLFHAQLDVASRRLTYVDAGHGHAFLRRTSGEHRRLTAGGLPLGVLAWESYGQGELELEPGDAVVIYSDGLVEADPEKLLDVGTIAAALTRAVDAEEMVDRLVSLAGSPEDRPDDLTVMVLYCCL